jgi:hypothetical protein
VAAVRVLIFERGDIDIGKQMNFENDYYQEDP